MLWSEEEVFPVGWGAVKEPYNWRWKGESRWGTLHRSTDAGRGQEVRLGDSSSAGLVEESSCKGKRERI